MMLWCVLLLFVGWWVGCDDCCVNLDDYGKLFDMCGIGWWLFGDVGWCWVWFVVGVDDLVDW